MDFRFLHAADIHLDSPLRGLSRYEGVPAELVRTATRSALENLVERAIEEQVAFVIIAGDLYDGDWDAISTGLFFCTAMGKLGRAGIEVFIVYGNHDAESNLTRQLPLPPNVRLFPSRRAESIVHEATGTVLHGQSYRTRDPGGDLAAGYPPAQKGALNIGVLHTALTGNRGPHAPYAPCTPEQLAAKGYHYWALGHVHGFEVVSMDPAIVFPGNLQGRNIREEGPKGAALVTVTHGEVANVEHVALDVVRWARVEVDVTPASSEAQAEDLIRAALSETLAAADGRPMLARVRLSGATGLHDMLAAKREALRENVRAIAGALSDRLWIEKVAIATSPPSAAAAATDEFATLLETLAADPELAADLAHDLGDFVTKAPADLDEELELLRLARAGDLGPVLADSAAVLRARLEGGVGA